MMDPDIEQLYAARRLHAGDAPSRRYIAMIAVAGAGLAAACLSLQLLTSASGPVLTLEGLGLVLTYAFVSRIEFEVGKGFAAPIQLVFVPMWFAAAPAYLPLLVVLGEIGGAVLDLPTHRRGRPAWRVLLAVPDAWYAVGPAVVLAAFGHAHPSLDDWPIYGLALAAQFLLDGVVATLRVWATDGVRPAIQLRLMLWIDAIDAALTPVGLYVAILMAQSAWVLVGVLPVFLLLERFSRDREESIDQALELSTAYRGTAELMGDVLEADDAYTGGEHTRGVVGLALLIGRELDLDPAELRMLEFAALLHDVGKLRVPNEIINKPGKLNDEEWAAIRMHPEWGQEMVTRVGGELASAGTAVRGHHERFDGHGYPDGLVGEHIPLAARIITVCDSFSAMTTNRSYRRAMTPEQALAELRRCSGTQFDPVVCHRLESLLERGWGADDGITVQFKAAELPPIGDLTLVRERRTA
jgi:hypothetical protein